jgi:chromosome partitioning protein
VKRDVLANQKGGVGKSAVACQLAHHLVAAGHRVLFVDLDHQRNSSRSLSRNARVQTAPFTTLQLIEGAQLACRPVGAFVLVGGDEGLSGLERRVSEHNTFLANFEDFLDLADGAFDFCLIDTNPNPDIRYVMALALARYVLSPIELNQEAIDGIRALLGHSKYGLHNIQMKINPKLELLGLLPNLVEPTPFQRGNLASLIREHGKLLIRAGGEAHQFAYIPTRTAIAEAQAEGAYLGDMKKTSARDAAREVRRCFEAVERKLAEAA